jgi:hypothetical protein
MTQTTLSRCFRPIFVPFFSVIIVVVAAVVRVLLVNNH